MGLKCNAKFAAVIAVFSILSVGISGCISSQSGYEFIGGTSHPKQITELLKNGPVVLYFGSNCTNCEKMKPIITNLETRYKGAGVTVLKIDPQKNATGKYYGVTTIPTTVVIRGDGAVAKFVGLTDETTLKNAVKDALKWK